MEAWVNCNISPSSLSAKVDVWITWVSIIHWDQWSGTRELFTHNCSVLGLQVASQIPNIWKKNSTHPNEENRPRKGGANQKRCGRSYGKRFDGQIRDRIAESGDFGTIQNKWSLFSCFQRALIKREDDRIQCIHDMLLDFEARFSHRSWASMSVKGIRLVAGRNRWKEADTACREGYSWLITPSFKRSYPPPAKQMTQTTGVILLPPQTMHYYKGNHSNFSIHLIVFYFQIG